MPTVYKVLGQVAPANTTNINLYTVPAATSAVISTLKVTNLTAAAVTFCIYVRVASAAASAANTVAKDVTLAPNSIFSATEGMTLAATDVLTVQSGTANALSFNLFGSEIS